MGDHPGNHLPRPRWRVALPWLGLFVVAALSAPLLLDSKPIDWVRPSASVLHQWASKALVLLTTGVAILLPAWLSRRYEPEMVWRSLLLAVAAALMTACHLLVVDRYHEPWQRDMYERILNHTMEAPHQYRPLPYGFTRTLEQVTGDWVFSCLLYRWFFTFWFVWCSYRLACLFLRPDWAMLTVVPVVLLYPLSVWFYWGQLTDPLSHALFALALICVVQDRWILLAGALALGVLAKETVLLVVPAYWAAHLGRGWPAFGKAVLLGLVGVATFLAARMPFGWSLSYERINGTTRLMIYDNLRIGEPYYSPAAPLYQNYLQPALFVLPFVPFIVAGWRSMDRRLQMLCLTLPPLLLASNLCFGWMYESRNYMPLVPLLATAALTAIAPARRREPPGEVTEDGATKAECSDEGRRSHGNGEGPGAGVANDRLE
jgi:hypothetical protein